MESPSLQNTLCGPSPLPFSATCGHAETDAEATPPPTALAHDPEFVVARLLDFQQAFHTETAMHLERVTTRMEMLVSLLGWSPLQGTVTRLGARLHDIGKIFISLKLLDKSEPLTDADWAVMRRHPADGYAFLRQFGCFSEETLNIVLHHHERWDGTGYPDGLRGAAIPLPARLFSIVDFHDAVRFPRAYRNGNAWTGKQAADYIHTQAGAQFDPELAAFFLDNRQWLLRLGE
jgi:HD-GYP domain-containing protein (c-di-GMP phosphodiesterase class II)